MSGVTKGNLSDDLVKGIVDTVTNDPRVREVFKTLGKDGKISVEQIEPVLGDSILKVLQSIDLLDGRDDDRVSRKAMTEVLRKFAGQDAKDKKNIARLIDAIPAEGIALHPKNVNRVVSSSLRKADGNDDWQLTMSELMDLGGLLSARADELIEMPNIPNRKPATPALKTGK